MPLLCVFSVRGDGLPSGQGKLRQENTWLRKATISYRAVTGHAYLCGMFGFYHMQTTMKAYLSSVPWYVSWWKNIIHERGELSRLSLQQSPISGGAITSFLYFNI